MTDTMLRPAISLLLLMSLNIAFSATPRKDLSTEYQDANRCVSETLGPAWAEHFGVEMILNEHGVPEPSEESISRSPDVVRIADLLCRRQAGLQGQGRPTSREDEE
jgi:hypothetical protein